MLFYLLTAKLLKFHKFYFFIDEFGIVIGVRIGSGKVMKNF